MMERYPFFRGGRLEGFVRTYGDYLEVTRLEREDVYLWEGRVGVRYTGGSPFFKACYEPPTAPSSASLDSLEERLKRVADSIGSKLAGRKVMVDFSGGKDSTLNLFLLKALSERVSFQVAPVYVHMPFLEPPENIDHAQWIAGKLGYDLEVVEPSRQQILFFLHRHGLPRRGQRWCTYLKMRALREARKRISPNYEARAERVAESGKRAERLSRAYSKAAFLSGASLNLVYDLGIEQVASVLREQGLVHPHYLDGLPRVSCSLCPYRSLYELELSSQYPLEDEGLVEHVASSLYRRFYSVRVSWEEFWSYRLWRFPPSIALARLEERAHTRVEDSLSLEEAREMFRSIWTSSAASRVEDHG
ncbi:MAG: hypothetical protein QXT33_01710 [Thermofilum sp.]